MPPPLTPSLSAAEVAPAQAQRCSHPCDDCYSAPETVDTKGSYSEQAKRVFFSIGESLQQPPFAASNLKVRLNEGSKVGPTYNGIKEEKREINCDKTELSSGQFRVTRTLDNRKGIEGFERLCNSLEPIGKLVKSKHSHIPTVPKILEYSGKSIDEGFINVRRDKLHTPLSVDKGTGSESFRKICLVDSETPRSTSWRRSSACLVRSVRGARVRGGGEDGRGCRSWYGGYGTLAEEDTTSANCWKQPSASSRGCNVAESATLLSTRAAPSAAVARRPRALHVLLGAAVAAARSRDSLHESPHVPVPLHNGSPRGLRKCSTTAALTSRRRASPDPDDVVLRKCPTAASLGGGVGGDGVEPMRPVNRLRPGSSGLCSRCSSLLSLAAGGSRYSLDVAGAGGFAPVTSPSHSPAPSPLLCKLCLDTVPAGDTTRIEQCSCAFCTKCMQAYVEFEVGGGAHEVSCPDASCPLRGVLQQREVAALAGPEALERLRRFRLNHEVVMDASRAWCPRAGCETVCRVARYPAPPPHPPPPSAPHEVSCPTCDMHFCSECNQEWHQGTTCDEAASAAAADGAAPLLPSGSELIKWCPMCRVPIEKDEGCAQMMCKRCKHVFCWFCLASLDDDFLLRHYDKGPCKNKLGHSRASVIWHRAQVVGIFAGFGLLLLVASPLLLLAAPCIVCCKCRLCSSNGAKNVEDGDEVETIDLGRDGEAGSPSDDIQRLPDAD